MDYFTLGKRVEKIMKQHYSQDYPTTSKEAEERKDITAARVKREVCGDWFKGDFPAKDYSSQLYR